MTNSIRQPFNPLQLELLELYARDVSNVDLEAIKKMLADYFAQKAIQEADMLWDERGYNDETMLEWLNLHERKSVEGESGN